MADQKKRVTQWDVAREAGVSRSQVSYVISGDTRCVSDKTRQKIIDAIDKLGYNSNKSAQKLRLGIGEYVSNLFGLIIPGPETFSNSFYAKLIAQIHIAAHEKGCKIHYIRFFDELKDTVLFNELIHPDEIGGLILLDLSKQAGDDKNGIIIEKIRSRMKNTVSIEWKTPLFPSVCFDKYKAGITAVDFLFSKGYTQIGYIGPVDERLTGIRDEMTANHLQIDGMTMVPAHDMKDGFSIAELLTEDHRLPRSIICGTDEIASGVLLYLNRHGIDVPQKVALIGMGNIEISNFTNPPLSTIDIKIPEIAQAAIDMITGGPYIHDSIIPAQMIARMTT